SGSWWGWRSFKGFSNPDESGMAFKANKIFPVDLQKQESIWHLPECSTLLSCGVQGWLANTNSWVVPRLPEVTMFPKCRVELGDPNVLPCWVGKFWPPIISVAGDRHVGWPRCSISPIPALGTLQGVSGVCSVHRAEDAPAPTLTLAMFRVPHSPPGQSSHQPTPAAHFSLFLTPALPKSLQPLWICSLTPHRPSQTPPVPTWAPSPSLGSLQPPPLELLGGTTQQGTSNPRGSCTAEMRTSFCE
uniref:Uncharacterized protein n=1 Tax=Bubo bubo TaxID=30461 RepID=A0A8C0IIU7_BUBBB